MVIIGFADYTQQARRLANCLDAPYREVIVHRFPDGESKVTVPTELAEHVVVCRSLNQPNDKLVELLLTANTIRQQGVRRLTLIAPYLCYMRQDIAFHPGEAISQRIVGAYLAGLFDDVVTVDPHLHRISRLEQAIPTGNAIALSATAALGEFLKTRWNDPLLIGPDSESEQWVRAIAERHGLAFAVAAKERLGDSDVRVSLPRVDVGDREVALVDDMASTGRTLIEAAEELYQRGARSVRALVTHALFSDETLARMRTAGIDFVGSTDSVTHASNVISLAPLLATAIRKLTLS